MAKVKPKKYLGQHFLKDKNIAQNIVNALSFADHYQTILEVGPGRGVLTEWLVQKTSHVLYLVEVDPELVAYLRETYGSLNKNIIAHDFLQLDLDSLWKNQSIAIIGNFPYNISSQIFFKIMDYRHKVHEVVCMIQKEVAERITAKPGSKTYGIPSVLLQAFYNIEYLFTVAPHVFIPPPQVQSAVVRLQRNTVKQLDCNEAIFFQLVKAGFQNRRKILRNALKHFKLPLEVVGLAMLNKRAEQLSVADFVLISKLTGGKL
ncbi:MAG: 16S rRNA (adenine(1518)-N(6)/adenine(1519)-N(6))-dimethyltransferase RsmA [Cytophagales bacterium]|nr:16S rRNA (adenine(1518)-N(6)/adenine(1519)-N(6))-dimethyltransferase RsmA [Cytophagales bacterium]